MGASKPTVDVIDKRGKKLLPCTKHVAWVLVKRRRARYLNSKKTAIKLLLTQKDLRELRRQVILRDNRTCIYCGKYIHDDNELSVDHLISRTISKKKSIGYDTMSNMACAHKSCNLHKDSMDFPEYVEYRVAIIFAVYSFYIKKSRAIALENIKKEQSDVTATANTTRKCL